ncbi:MAG: helix-turn-helix domain-containing protein [Sandaracinus sp.]
MEERDKLEPRGAMLDPARAARTFVVTRHLPAPALAPFVRHYWLIRWALSEPFVQSVLPLPTANAVIEAQTDTVGLSAAHRFDRTLEGQGAVFGTLFRPTGLAAIAHAPAHRFARPSRFATIFRGDVEPVRARAFGGASDAEVVSALDAYWLAEEPRVDPQAEEVERWVALAESERTIGRAEVLAAKVGVTVRTLERRMRALVGFTPKQLLRRYRLQEAAARLEAGDAVDHAALAQELGYSDQAHFVRDFGAAVGRPPARYARAQERAAKERVSARAR